MIKKYKQYKEIINKYNYAIFIMRFDSETDCPKNDIEYSLSVQNYFEEKILKIIKSKSYINLINELYNKRDELDEILREDIIIEYKNNLKLSKIPSKELINHYKNLSKCHILWQNARKDNDYNKFLKEEEKLVNYYKKYIKWQETENLKGFDVLLDEMEEGYNREKYDSFFSIIEKELVPFINKVINKPQKYNKKLDDLKFDIEKQKILTKKIMEIMEYTEKNGCIRETIHPFTDWANNNDVRITTSYSESDLFSNLYSVMHEVGHALFQLQMDDKYNDTNIYNNVTCITHESQSRFYENYLGRSKSFIKYLYKILKDLFKDEFEDITELDLYYYVNKVKPIFKRTESDELTYPIHILIRYKIECMLFDNKITVYEMEKTFNDLMKKYLNITPSNMTEGVFQDVHWTSDFGYFPTYAVGSSYGIYFLDEMNKEFDVSKELENGSFKRINKWLKENIHKFSGTRKNDEIIKYISNCDFNPMKYINYLKKKFSEIYEVE